MGIGEIGDHVVQIVDRVLLIGRVMTPRQLEKDCFALGQIKKIASLTVLVTFLCYFFFLH